MNILIQKIKKLREDVYWRRGREQDEFFANHVDEENYILFIELKELLDQDHIVIVAENLEELRKLLRACGV